jgi:hypothetical protein
LFRYMRRAVMCICFFFQALVVCSEHGEKKCSVANVADLWSHELVHGDV